MESTGGPFGISHMMPKVLKDPVDLEVDACSDIWETTDSGFTVFRPHLDLLTHYCSVDLISNG